MSGIPVMRNMIHRQGKRAIIAALVLSFSATFGFFFGYVQPRQRKYDEFFKNYDAYEHMREICSHNKGYMHTCPQELAKLYAAKGKPIAPLD
ncbi:hypothetical protein AB6A40_005804 [Gnathostoma spinigerum]|uniref:Mitochondrial cytochrome c oxidase subunit VIc/VIIs domain-containing protein n=1 Tax=Gnathostoma spinigerum TaxID=75299 RepID=A0ABD6ES67_9BILA